MRQVQMTDGRPAEQVQERWPRRRCAADAARWSWLWRPRLWRPRLSRR